MRIPRLSDRVKAEKEVISFFTPLRVDSEHESIGLDASLHGESAYQK